MIIMLIIAGVLVGGLVAFQDFKTSMIEKGIKGTSTPPQAVSTVVAQESVWQPTVEALGSFSASKQASLSAEVSGLVTSIQFASGQKVRLGQTLVELNPAPLKAQLARRKPRPRWPSSISSATRHSSGFRRSARPRWTPTAPR